MTYCFVAWKEMSYSIILLPIIIDSIPGLTSATINFF